MCISALKNIFLEGGCFLLISCSLQ